MRVAMKFSSAPTDACTSYTYGEVEDYYARIYDIMGTSDKRVKTEAQVYPNPATDVLNITKATDKTTYTIFNLAGQAVAAGKVAEKKVPVANLEKGVYMISIKEGNEENKVKFIKK